MTTNAFLGGWTFKRGNGASPEVFTAVEESFDLPGLGEVAELVTATHFGSNSVAEYIAGISDGSEFTLVCNQVLTSGSIQEDLRGDKSSTINIQIVVTDGTNTLTLDMAVVVLGYEYGPSVEDKNTITFTFKITGSITES